MEGLEIIKKLVDSLTVSLTNILLKIESINPILNHLDEEMKDGKNISQDTVNAVNELKHEILSYHESMIQLPVTLSKINEMKKDIDDIKKKTDNIPNISQQFETNNNLLTPISTFANWITSPLGKIGALVAALLAIAGAVQTVQWIIETFFK